MRANRKHTQMYVSMGKQENHSQGPRDGKDGTVLIHSFIQRSLCPSWPSRLVQRDEAGGVGGPMPWLLRGPAGDGELTQVPTHLMLHLPRLEVVRFWTHPARGQQSGVGGSGPTGAGALDPWASPVTPPPPGCFLHSPVRPQGAARLHQQLVGRTLAAAGRGPRRR